MSSRFRNIRTAALVLAAVITIGLPSLSARRILEIPAGDEQADPSQQGVYVKDSAIAADKFELGKKMERLQEWPKSADIYQEILEKYKDRVVPIAFNDKQQATKYASVCEAVRARLAKWPQEGLTVYRNRFEPKAAELLDQAKRDDAGALHEVYDRYFVTESARKAGLQLMDLYMEMGEFAGAAQVGQRLLEMHPSLGNDEPLLLFCTASALHLSGNNATATHYAQDLLKRYAQATAMIGGQQVKLVDAMEKAMAGPPANATSASSDGYPMIGGDASRTALSAASADPTSRVALVQIPAPSITAPTEQLRSGALSYFENARTTGMGTSVMPAVDRGELFFQDGQRLWAVHLESGVPLAGWQQTYSGRSGMYVVGHSIVANQMGEPWNSMQFSSPRQFSVTVTDDAVLAVMGMPDQRMMVGFGGIAASSSDSGTRLVCLDRVTGHLRWMASPADIPNNAGNPKNISFSGSPLVVGDNVYVIGRGSTGAGVEDCHVLCYDMNPGRPAGRLRWTCYIASSQNGVANFGMPVMAPETLSHLAFAGGKVFVCTNLGAVAAIDAYSGATAWLVLYTRNESAAAGGRNRGMWNGWNQQVISQDTPRPWVFNPVMVSDGKLFVLPADARYLAVYDAATGEEIKQIPRDLEITPSNSGRLDMLLAVNGRILAVATSTMVVHLDWTKAAVEKNNRSRLTPESVPWFFDFGDKISGRPFISKTSLVVPTVSSLSVFNIRNPANGRIVKRYPTGEWPSDKTPDREAPGNVVVAQDHVIIANPWNVSIYSDMASARKKFDVALLANPSDVDARLVFSEQNFNAGEYQQSLGLLDEAVKVLGGLKDQASPARNRIFADALLFAQRIQTRDPQATDMASQLFDRVAAAASNASQQVVYRTARARFHESLAAKAGKREGLARAVELYQEILLDNDFRTVTLSPDDTSAPRQAGGIAEDAIRELVKRGGPEVYAAFEKTASDLLASLTAAGKPDDLMEIAEKYPNAAAAPKALLQAATFYEQQDKPRMAVQVLRRLYWKYNSRFTDGTQRLDMAQAMARNYLRSGNFPAALGRLERAATMSSGAPVTTPLLLPDNKLLANAGGKPVKTIAEAVAALEAFTQQRAESLPDVGVPVPRPMTTEERIEAMLKNPPKAAPFLPENPQSVVAGVQLVLEPPSSLADMNRYDRLVACSGNRISAYAPGQAQSVWNSDAQLEDPRAAAWLDAARLVIWGGGGLAMIDGDSGRTRWAANLASLPPLETLTAPIAGNEQPDVNAAAAPGPAGIVQLGGGQVFLRGGGQLVVQGIPAQPLQPAQPAPPAAQPAEGPKKVEARERVTALKPLNDRIVLSTDAGRVVALALADGHMLWQTRLCNGSGIQRLLASGDFVVGMVTEGTGVVLAVLDTYSGQQVWKKVFSTMQGAFPQNCILADDGTLVWTTYNSIVARDLYEPNEPGWIKPGRNYAGMTQPEHLAVYGQQVMAVCDGGRLVDRRFLRDGQNSGLPLGTESQDASVQIRLMGPQMYLVGIHSFMTYRLDREAPVKPTVEEAISLIPSEMLVSRKYAIIPAVPAPIPNNNEEPVDYRLLCYSRQLVKSDNDKLIESGNIVHDFRFNEPAHVRSWHMAEGGIYYLTGDDKLHFLKGAAKP
ncbi:MAG: PQQ-binding-like beta-propeller repeat protein [Tepidisphaerales bacterium]